MNAQRASAISLRAVLAEREALVTMSLLEVYVRGVSPRKVRRIVERLCGNAGSASAAGSWVNRSV